MKSLGGTNLSPDETELKSRVSLIESVKSPLGFFTLAIVILEGILLAESVTIGRIEPWMPFLLMAIVIVIVKPSAVGVPQDKKQPDRIVVLIFPENTVIDFNDDSGELIINPQDGEPTTIPFTPIDNHSGGWNYTLPKSVKINDALRICVTDTTGKRWRTKSFIPLQIPQKLKQFNPGHGGGL